MYGYGQEMTLAPVALVSGETVKKGEKLVVQGTFPIVPTAVTIPTARDWRRVVSVGPSIWQPVRIAQTRVQKPGIEAGIVPQQAVAPPIQVVRRPGLNLRRVALIGGGLLLLWLLLGRRR